MNRNLLLIAFSLFFWGIGETSFLAYQPLYLQELGAAPILIGGILGAFGFANAISHLPAGILSDRFGRRPIMLSAWVIGLMATGIMALATTLSGFVCGALLYGITMFVIAPLNSYITTARGRWSVGRALTAVSASFNLGAIIGPSIGGYLGDNFGFRSIFIFAAVSFIFSTAIIFQIQPQPIETQTQDQNFLRLLDNRRFLTFLVIFFVAALAMFLPQPLTPNYLQDHAGFSFQSIGRVYSLSSLGVVLLNIILGMLDARMGFILGQVSVGLFALIIWQQEGIMWYSLAFILLGGYRAARALAIAVSNELIDSARMGTAYGVSETIGSIATILAPILAGSLFAIKPELMYVYSVVLIIAAITISGFFLMRKQAFSMARR
jgi:DHA1 family multidrug resistance protein-like MFS transporter